MTAPDTSLLSSAYPSLEQAECPYPYYEAGRRESPVIQVPGRGEFLVTKHDDVMYVMRHPEIFSSAVPNMGSDGIIEQSATDAEESRRNASMVLTDPPTHKAKRSLSSRPFTPKRLAGYEPMIQGIVDDLIDSFPAGECEFVSEFAAPLPVRVTCEILGIPASEYERVARWGQLEGNGTRFLPPDQQAKHAEWGMEMGGYLMELIQQRHEEPGEDGISELIALQVERDGELDLPYLINEGAILLLGGVVTTAHMIASTLLLLLDHPDQMESVRADRALLPRAIEESLRVECPVQWQPRITQVDTELDGVEIPAGSIVLIVFGSANRDEEKFDHPAEFEISRANVKDHVAFGYGTHFCLGAPLARLEGRLGIGSVLDRLHGLRLNREKSDLSHIQSTIFRSPVSLHLEFEKS